MKPLLIALLLLPAPGFAQTIYGLGTITGPNFRGAPLNSQALIAISPVTGASLTLTPVALTGPTAGQQLVGMDFRPANNLLYALGYDAAAPGPNARVYLLNPATNAAAAVGAAVRLELGDAANRIGFDVNPVDDRLRVTSTNGADYQLDPASGALVATAGPLAYAGGARATVSAVAYTNSYAGSQATTAYVLDYRSGELAVQSPLDAGPLAAPLPVKFVLPTGPSAGTYGIGQPDALGLDIYYNPAIKASVGYVTEVTAPRSDGTRASNVYRLDLATGLATRLGNTVPASALLNFEIRDLAVSLPVNVPLPVELVGFTAVAAAPAAVRLAWATASETRSAYFAVERSTDGTRYAPVGQVAAAGTSATAHTYGLTDAALPAGAALLYYRLRQVDQDGASHYSPVRPVAVAAAAAGLRVYPTPASAAATLTGAPSGASVLVFDARGRRVATAVADATGTAALAAGLPPGVYVVRSGSRTARWVVD